MAGKIVDMQGNEIKTEETFEHIVSKEDVEMNPGGDLKEGELIEIPIEENEIPDPESDVVHPLLVLEKDNFTFDPPQMDRDFYEALYNLNLKIGSMIPFIKDEELNQLNGSLTHFLGVTASKLVKDGEIESVKYKDWSERVKEILEKFKAQYEEESK